MRYRFVQVRPPVPRVIQGPNGCAPTVAAIGASLVTGCPADEFGEILQRDLLTKHTGGKTLNEVAVALKRYHIRSEFIKDVPLRRVLELHPSGALILGIEGSFMYRVRYPSPHAVLIARVALPVVSERLRALLGGIPDYIPPIEFIDPEGSVPERRTVTCELLELAYNAAYRQALFIPGIWFKR